MDAPTEVTLNGVTYKRNPSAQQRANRVYFSAPRGSGWGMYHRDLYESVHGAIPAGWIVHHVDHDPLNNAIENLAAIDRKAHAAEHEGDHVWDAEHLDAIRPLASEWHRSEEGRAWHQEHGRAVWENIEPVATGRRCDGCGKPIVTRMPGKDPRFCSRRCSRVVADAAHRYEIEVACPVCDQLFWQSIYKVTPRTCSRRCGSTLAWRSRRMG